MNTTVNLYSTKNGEIERFLQHFYGHEIKNINELKWEKTYSNPIEIADIIGTFIENAEDYQINMWVSLDEGTFINVTNENADSIIRYLYERFPY